MKRFLIAGAVTFLFGLASNVNADIIIGPALTNDATDTYTGLLLTAQTNSVLQGFIYHNQGGTDTVELATVIVSPVNGALEATNILGSISVPFGAPTFTASNLTWQMTAGTMYALVSSTGNNGTYAPYDFSTTPASDTQIAVDSGIFSFDLNSIATNPNDWGDFNNITTASVPEPSSWILLSLVAIVGFLGWQLARRRREAHACALGMK